MKWKKTTMPKKSKKLPCGHPVPTRAERMLQIRHMLDQTFEFCCEVLSEDDKAMDDRLGPNGLLLAMMMELEAQGDPMFQGFKETLLSLANFLIEKEEIAHAAEVELSKRKSESGEKKDNTNSSERRGVKCNKKTGKKIRKR